MVVSKIFPTPPKNPWPKSLFRNQTESISERGTCRVVGLQCCIPPGARNVDMLVELTLLEPKKIFTSYGGLLKCWYPQMINSKRMFHFKPSVLIHFGYLYFQESPIDTYILYMISHVDHHLTCFKKLSRALRT